MEESILTSIKSLLEIPDGVEDFDTNVVIYINTVFSTLNQLGAGPSGGFSISDASATWDSYSDNVTLLGLIKSYMHLKVKMLFDSNAMTGAVLDSTNRMISDLEFRIIVETERAASIQ